MKIVIAPDSYKDCLSAMEVAHCMADGIASIFPVASIVLCPMSDGGEGAVQAVAMATGRSVCKVTVADPLGRPVSASYLPLANTALIEMAEASGLERLTLTERNPLHTHTVGTGQLIAHALNTGIRDFILAVGGSGTVDGGMGMATALGYRFWNEKGHLLQPSGGELIHIARVDMQVVDARLRGCSFRVAADVTSPLLGALGAARRFGPQKGATPQMVDSLEEGLFNLQQRCRECGLLEPLEQDGDGAAGGLGMGVRAFLGGQIVSGAATIATLVGLQSALDGADWVVTGEGRTDAQSAAGKVCGFIQKEAGKRNIPVYLLSGSICADAETFVRRFAGAASVSPPSDSLATALAGASENIRQAAAEMALTILRKR